MATLAATIIIEGKRFDRDADLLKNLRLENKLRSGDRHTIGRPNILYHNALNIPNEVFVGEIAGHTLICSDYIPSDFIGGFSTLKTGIFTQFPQGKKVVFFSNSTSLLNGFIIYEGQKLIRMKVVQNGKLEKISNDDLDFGELLDLETKQYHEQNPIRESKDYLWGIHDLNIAQTYIEQQFNIDNLEQVLSELTCNKYTPDEISETDRTKTHQEKLSVKDIHDAGNQVILSNFDNLVEEKTKDNFPTVSRTSKYSLALNHHTLSIHNTTNFRPPSGTNAEITVYLLPNTPTNFPFLPYFTEGLGLPVINFNAHEILVRKGARNERIILQDDLTSYLEEVNFQASLKQALLMDSVENIFTLYPLYFSQVFENLKAHTTHKGWIQGYLDIRILITRIFFELKINQQEQTYQQLKDFLTEFESTKKHFKKSSDDKAKKFLVLLESLYTNFKPVIKEHKKADSNPIEIQKQQDKNQKKWWQLWK